MTSGPEPVLNAPQVGTYMITGLDPDRGGAGSGRARIPSASALCQARRRIGAAPLCALFDLLRGPAGGPRTPGLRWRGLLVCAIDGTQLCVPDGAANLTAPTTARAQLTTAAGILVNQN